MRGWRALAARLLPQRLGRRLQLMVSLGLGLTVSLFGAWTIHEQSALALGSIETEAAALARNIALSSENPILTDQLDVIETLLMRAADFPQLLEVRVTDAHGESLGHVVRSVGGTPRVLFDPPGSRIGLPPQTSPLSNHESSGNRVVAWHPIVAGTLLGWVRLERSTEALGAMRQRIWFGTIVAGLIAAASSAALLGWLLRSPVRSIGRSKDFAVGLARIDGQQIDSLEGSVETRELGIALNQASTRLFEQRLAIDAGMATLQRQEAVLADTNEQLSTIFALSPDALLSFDAAGRIRFANEAFFRISGLAVHAVIGQPAAMIDAEFQLRCADPQTYPGLDSFFTAADANKAGPADRHVRPRLTLARPRLQVLEIVGLHSHSPSVSRLLYVRDVTHESEVDRMKSEFLTTAAHELRTPMTTISGCIELLLAREFDAARRQELLGMAHRQSDVMVTIIDQLLDFARIEARRGADFEFEMIPLGDLLQQALGDFAVPAGRLAPELLDTPDSGWVLVDRGKALQVVRNLLSNAYKYSSSGAVQVRLLAKQPGSAGERLGFQVSDHGIGMTPEQLARVCERFYRADASGHVSGTGLGMSIVQEIVTLMGGTLELESLPNQGTTVTVWLPCAPSALQAGSAAQGVIDQHTGEQREADPVV
ncbi:MAG: PAS domain-containing sensor histidine kinase [Pseudomonadota bacterium]|nr:PAS domain-containing sensor histidine kinase [Pseudomonadota bacterium]